MAGKNSDTQQRIQKLREVIAHHQKRYHELDAPLISDEAYDSLVTELRTLEGSTDDTTGSVATEVGGAPSEAFKKVTHAVRQWSLGNVFTESELREWEERLYRHLTTLDVANVSLQYVVEHKLDGLKVVLTYKKGKLVQGATRGDGRVGEDVTHTVRTIADVPHTLTEPVDLVCVGEVWLGEKEFHRINKERERSGEPLFANPRNAAAGSLRQLDAEVTKQRNLSVMVYDIDRIDTTGTSVAEPESQWAELALLRELGFTTNRHNVYAHSIDDVITFYTKWKEKHNTLPYGVDGVVVKVNSIAHQKLLGYTAKSPRYGIAFKFPAEQATTVVEDIQLQVGRTGVITPVAHLRPVLIDGSTVSRATLHNEDHIRKLDVRTGDTVILQKAGDVIPEILEVVLPLRPDTAKPFRFPKKVDDCGGDGSIERIPGAAAYRCVTMESDFLHRQRLYHFVSKHGLNVDGVGERIIDLLLDNGLIAHADDLFTLEAGDLKDLPGFKEKAAQNVVDAIAAARKAPLHRLLVALSIEHIGEETARLIAEQCGSIDAVQHATEEEIEAIHGVGDIAARSLVAYMHDPKHVARLQTLLQHLSIIEPEKRDTNTPLSGKTVVFTGTLPTLTRDDAKDRARRAGAHIASSVSKQTDYVVVGDDAGTKAAKAASLGVTQLTEAEFLKLLGA
ncbi:MAG: NAD-dependent DNA ligase LigA [Candidatus Paceibacterota bacterium]